MKKIYVMLFPQTTENLIKSVTLRQLFSCSRPFCCKALSVKLGESSKNCSNYFQCSDKGFNRLFSYIYFFTVIHFFIYVFFSVIYTLLHTIILYYYTFSIIVQE